MNQTSFAGGQVNDGGGLLSEVLKFHKASKNKQQSRTFTKKGVGSELYQAGTNLMNDLDIL